MEQAPGDFIKQLSVAPHVQEAQVAAVSDRTTRITLGDGGALVQTKHLPADVDDWAFLNTKLTNEAITQQVDSRMSKPHTRLSLTVSLPIVCSL